ncbi:MAG: hypothetical protein M0R66_03645 [Candidatus Omnitrophica bacterium]|nr:hypothetical protein [Candidatus Omnitrophota bacterium]
MNPTEFATLHPEFRPTVAVEADYVTAVLAAVEVRVSDSWADEREEIIALEAASTIAQSPLGRAAQLLDSDGESTYSRELARRYAAHAYAYARIA